MTVSAVSAVSLQPPLILICVNREATFHAALDSKRGFALNVLATGQEAISEAFASGVDDPFATMNYRMGPAQLPLVDGAVAHIICAPWGTHAAGDHTVFFGKVTDGSVFEGRPLVHYRSRYTTTLESGHNRQRSKGEGSWEPKSVL
jgi:flavin reductase (DIM6/NTAB) family NADH-FMN oxidoreductase RutF